MIPGPWRSVFRKTRRLTILIIIRSVNGSETTAMALTGFAQRGSIWGEAEGWSETLQL